MKRTLSASVCLLVSIWCAACNSSSQTTAAPINVNVSGAFTAISAGGSPVTLTATVSGDPGSQGVTWTLSIANTGCSPGCGTLKASGNSTAIYTPPVAPPVNGLATITAASVSNTRQIFAFNFQILPPIAVTISPKFSTQTAGGPVVDLSASVTNDPSNAGVTWTLTAGSAACAPDCGTLTQDPAPALTAHYQPPAAPPTGANASPTITATSNAVTSISDKFTFTIVAPPISVAILNKFASQSIGGPAVNVNASVSNDFTNAGLTWALTANNAPCSPNCGTLIPAAVPSLSAVYTPPTVLPVGANAAPTITATSVADTTRSDSFSFTLVTASSIFNGSYALLLRGFDSAGAPMVLAGSITSNGAGSISGGELDLNDNGVITTIPSPVSGSYVLDTSFNGIPRITITLTVPAGTVVLKCVMSLDGKRARLIEFDGSHALNAGTLLQQDSAALAAANPAGSYAFGLDSDAGSSGGVTGRIVEAGRIVLGAGGTSVTSGLADAGQAGASSALFGGPTGAASLDAASTATAPDALGRGTLTLSFAGIATQYAYYIVSAQQLNLVEIDTGGSLHTVQSGTAQLQNALTASSINATSVIALTGVNRTNTASSVIIGVLSIAGGNASTATFDTNNGGTVATAQTTSGVFFSPFDPTTGRCLIANSPSIATNFVGASLIYLYDTGKGFLIDVTPNNNAGSFNFGYSGSLSLQSAGPFTIPTHLSGNAVGVAGASSEASIPNIDFALNLAAGAASPANYSAMIDLTTSNLGVGASGQVADVPLSSEYIIDDANLGRGRMGFTGGVFGNFSDPSTDIASIYLVGPNQFVAIEQSGIGPSGILFFDPE